MEEVPKRKKRAPSRKLTPTDRANIVIEREMRGITGKTNKDIAVEQRCSEFLVQHTTAGNLPAEARKIYKKKKARLDELAMSTTVAALLKGKELIDKADNPKHLSGIAAVGKMSDNIFRLETHQPTAIQQTLPAESHALEFIKMLMQRMAQAEALEAFKRTSLEPLVPEQRKLEIIRRIEAGELKLLTA